MKKSSVASSDIQIPADFYGLVTVGFATKQRCTLSLDSLERILPTGSNSILPLKVREIFVGGFANSVGYFLKMHLLNMGCWGNL